MEVLDQGSLQLTGAEEFGEIAEASLHQGIGVHGMLTVTVWIRSGTKSMQNHTPWVDMPVSLIPAGRDREPIFSGLVKKASFRSINGRPAVQLSAFSCTIQMDIERRIRSYQKESRTYGELARCILASYDGAYIWNGSGRDETVGRFLMQYQESDWQFLQRAASLQGQPLIPESRFPGVKLFIGLPDRKGAVTLEAETCHITKRLASIRRNGDNEVVEPLQPGVEITVRDRYEDFLLGDLVDFRGSRLVVTAKTSALKHSEWVHSYTMRSPGSCHVERMDNPLLAGAAVKGYVMGTTAVSSMLSLETDGEDEIQESWHIQPVYYAGGGAGGYSGQPEKGDTQYLYFPTPREEDRYIIGGADAGAEQITASVESDAAEETADEEKDQPSGPAAGMGGTSGSTVGADSAPDSSVSHTGTSGGRGGREPVTPETLPQTKNWNTPGRRRMTLNTLGVCFGNGSKGRVCVYNSGIRIYSDGDLTVETEHMEAYATGKLILEAEDYIWMESGRSGVLLHPEALEVKSDDITIKSPDNEPHPILSDDTVEMILEAYEEWKNTLPPLVAADGSIIHRDGFDDILITEEMYYYFHDNYYGKGDYENPDNGPEDLIFMTWLDDVYGRCAMGQFWDSLSTLDNLQMALDVIGIFWEPADLLNAVISFCRGNYVEGVISLICCFPLIGDMLGKGGRYVAGALGVEIKTIDLTFSLTGGISDLIASLRRGLNKISARAMLNGTDIIEYGGAAVASVSKDAAIRITICDALGNVLEVIETKWLRIQPYAEAFATRGDNLAYLESHVAGEESASSAGSGGSGNGAGGGASGGNNNRGNGGSNITSGSNFRWGNPKSTPTYGHTFSQHGQRQTLQQLIGRANGFENPHQVGQWLDDQQAADFLANVVKDREGVFDVPLPSDISARVVLPDGTTVAPDRVWIIMKPDGSIRTAYPYSSLFPTK